MYVKCEKNGGPILKTTPFISLFLDKKLAKSIVDLVDLCLTSTGYDIASVLLTPSRLKSILSHFHVAQVSFQQIKPLPGLFTGILPGFREDQQASQTPKLVQVKQRSNKMQGTRLSAS